MCRILAFLICFSFLSSNLNAQLLEQEDSYDRCDTLRGTLNEFRSSYDVFYYNLNISIDPEKKSISGYNDIHFTLTNPTPKIQIDLFDHYTIESVQLIGDDWITELEVDRDCQAFFVETEGLEVGKKHWIKVTYSGFPTVAKRAPWDGGFVWSKDKDKNDWIGVACEGFGASSWWPNKDHLSDEPDSMKIVCTVPEDLVAVCNGNLMNTEHDEEKALKTYSWKVNHPINNYNVTVNIGNYVHFAEEYINADGELLAHDYYVLPYNLKKAKKQFAQVKPMMECFEEYLGKYPFYEDGFALVETPYLGMEHQSAIAYGNDYKTGYAGRDYSRIGLDFDYIIIHEAGHEWWGNSVSMKDISDMWIHEGFCTYSEALYVECLHGYETAMDYVNAKVPTIRNESPMLGKPGVNEEGSGDMYNKGMLILNTVRHLLEDDQLWFDIIKGIAEDFKYQTTDTKAIIDYINEKSGKNFDDFFEQYLANAAIPKLEYKVKRSGKIKYKWKADVSNFDMPVKLQTNDDQFEWIFPVTASWKKTKLKDFDKSYFYIDQRHFYFEAD